MSKMFPTIMLLLLLLLAGTGIRAENIPDAPDASLDRFLEDIKARVRDTRTVQCRFEQERNLAIFTQPVIFSGRMVLSRPDRLRWENIKPIPSVLIFNGDKGQRCNDDAPPVRFDLRTDPVMNMVARQIWTWVDGDYTKLRKDYSLALTGGDTLELTPKAGSTQRLITSVRITFDRSTLQPQTIRIGETGGDSTVIRFSGYQLNQAVDERLFTTCFP